MKAFLLKLCLQSTKSVSHEKGSILLQMFEKPSGFTMTFAQEEGREGFTGAHLQRHDMKSYTVTSEITCSGAT